MPKVLVAVCAFVVAVLQAWDSHALDAEVAVRWLVFAGVSLPALAMLATRDVRVRGGAVLLAAAIMVTCRVVSAQPMPGLALAAFFPGMLTLLDHIRSLNAANGAGTKPLVDTSRKG